MTINGQWNEKKTILVILAHPDDPEFFLGGTIAQWTLAGHRVVYCLFTRGDKGANNPSLSAHDLAVMREKEQRAAAKVVGVEEITFLDYRDGELIPSLDARKDVVRKIRQIRPQILVTCDPTNFYSRSNYLNHPDHRNAGQIVLDAYFPAAGSPMFFPELLAEGLQPHSVEEIWISLAANPNTIIDVTSTWQMKLTALMEHKSQIGDPLVMEERMKNRRAADSTEKNPRYEESFLVLKFN